MDTEKELAFYRDNAGTYNCYAFALGAKTGTYGHPGAASDKYLRSLNPSEIDASLQSDGLIPAPHKHGEVPPEREGHYLVAAVSSGPTTSGPRDYHFYRQMPDGSWWHDPGKQAPTNVDTEGKVVTNPETAGRDYTRGSLQGNPSRQSGYDNFRTNYNNFVGYYYVPNEGLKVAPGTLPDHVLESPSMKQERIRQEQFDKLFPDKSRNELPSLDGIRDNFTQQIAPLEGLRTKAPSELEPPLSSDQTLSK